MPRKNYKQEPYQQKPVTIKEYNKLMDKIVKQGLSVEDTLIKLLETASKYKIKGVGK